MTGAKSTLNCLIVISAVLGLLLVAGCGGSSEKDHMATFIQDYQTSLDNYAAAINKADSAQKAEIEAKLEASETKWLNLKEEAAQNVTPQVMEKFEKEFQAVKKKYESLNGKS